MERCIRACNVVNERNPVGQQLHASDLLSQCPPCEADLSVSLRVCVVSACCFCFIQPSLLNVLPLMAGPSRVHPSKTNCRPRISLGL